MKTICTQICTIISTAPSSHLKKSIQSVQQRESSDQIIAFDSLPHFESGELFWSLLMPSLSKQAIVDRLRRFVDSIRNESTAELKISPHPTHASLVIALWAINLVNSQSTVKLRTASDPFKTSQISISIRYIASYIQDRYWYLERLVRPQWKGFQKSKTEQSPVNEIII